MSKPARILGLIVVLMLLLPVSAAAAVYKTPVDGHVTDKFRPPSTPYGPGNRGWEYASTAGSPVGSAADGTVTFAGQVGGVLNVVVRHDDGVLTTYSKLQSISVVSGEFVHAGDAIGRASTNVYFGARCGGRYIDPAMLFGIRVYLVPDKAGEGRAGSAPNCKGQPQTTPNQEAWLAGAVPAYWQGLRATLTQLHF